MKAKEEVAEVKEPIEDEGEGEEEPKIQQPKEAAEDTTPMIEQSKDVKIAQPPKIESGVGESHVKATDALHEEEAYEQDEDENEEEVDSDFEQEEKEQPAVKASHSFFLFRSLRA